MGDSTDQPTDQPTNQPTNEPAKKKKKKKKKKKHTSTWIAVISALVATAAVAISVWQVRLASQQNAVTEQDHLVQLTTNIAEQIAQGQATPGGTALSDELVTKLTVEGQAGTILIDELKDNGVAGYEYIEVAQALAFGGNAADAITDYKAALKVPPHDPWTRASALRFMGILYYQIDQPRIGHQTLVRAAKVLSEGRPLNSRSYIANSIAQAYVVDAYHQLLTPYKGCSTYQDDMKAAQKAIGSYPPSANVQVFANAAKKAYQTKCTGSGAA
jgi:hypothetical protein